MNKKDWVATGVPFFRTREIVQLSKFGICDNELFISERLYDELISSGTVPEKNDVMLTGVGTIGIPYVVIEHDRFYFKDASVLIFKNIFNLWPNYLDLFFRSPCWIEQIHDGSMGTTVHTLTIVRANAIKIPIPPAEEQLRIVAKVGELMALCDQLEQCSESQLSAHQTLVETLLATLTDSTDADKLAQNWARLSTHFDTLFTTEASIDALKQTILQLAVMGKLVSQDPSDEPASALLERIAAEKALLVKEKKIKKEKPLPEISENEKPFELPKGWEWCRLGALMPQFQNGASSRGDSGGIPITVLRLADIKDWKVSLADTRELSIDSKSIDKYSLEKGDTLIIRVNGSSDIVGRFIGCDENYDAIYCDHFIRMRFLVEVFNTRYLSLLGSSNIVRSHVQNLKRQAN
ncbi:hypothetical protein KAM448_45240 [Aeromonas caviae]|uniref:Type I restriction modification DNA specificity domain-containing protein n=1 Tax=Aeromonas caviae TaxID=648 RepID=A0ABD0BEH2_AERCA|nr:restriction endonuclease subunit S [Aeromonas caviae]GJA83920.1 hypothetical protein KAM355_44800 [Aeromonas caviae]GJB13974.1 hypothetical protein KAM362_45340 [Aeromonas caviae]GJB26780.1 hypothetical protein KAM365_45300 [Aeromonas caviae]GJB35409.1 hypothetical protein KAM367_45110 [Aeromonas caviae]GJB61928.1 hypothetical protein KAM374_44640 [Aeromonas caviae]